MNKVTAITKLLPKPNGGVFQPSAEDWEKIEAEMSIAFPQDFKDFVAIYGAGSINDCFVIWSPFCNPPAGDMRQVLEILEIERGIREDYPEFHPGAIFPEVGGLFPWGRVDRDYLFWKTEGPPDSWVIAYRGFEELITLELSFSEFIEQTITGRLTCELFSSFADRSPVFEPVS